MNLPEKKAPKKNLLLFVVFVVPLLVPVLCSLFSLFSLEKSLSLVLDEDKILENSSVLIWLILLVLFLLFALKLRAKKLAFYFYLALSLIAFFVTMEEISWGQRIFQIKTPEFFSKNNYQNEIGLHNTKIGNVSVNKFISGKIAPVFILVYFFFFPLLQRKNNRLVTKIIEYLKLPLMPLKYLWILLLYLLVSYTAVFYSRKGELVEFYVPYLFCVLFINKYLKITNDKKRKQKS